MHAFCSSLTKFCLQKAFTENLLPLTTCQPTPTNWVIKAIISYDNFIAKDKL